MAETKKSVKKTTTKKVTEKVEARKNKKELSLELRKLQDEILVEISNISAMKCSFGNRNGDVYFDFMPGDFEELTLGELKEVVKTAKSFFSEYSIIITDVLNKEYTVEDIIEYLSLKSIYKDVEDNTEDFIKDILELDDEDFKEAIEAKKGDKNLIRNVATKGVYLTRAEDEDYELSRAKENVLCDALGRAKNSLINIL